MRKFNQKFPIIYIIIPLILGFFIGYDIKDDFLNFYFGNLAQSMERYTIIIAIIFIDYNIFKNVNYTSIIFRHKTLLNFFYKHFVKSIIYISTFFLVLNIPSLIFNFKDYMSNLNVILPNIVCDIIISILFISIIRLIDVFIKKRILSSIIFIIGLVILELVFTNTQVLTTMFDFQHIFILATIYNFYYLILLIMVFIIFLNISICSNLILKGDYMLNDKSS